MPRVSRTRGADRRRRRDDDQICLAGAGVVSPARHPGTPDYQRQRLGLRVRPLGAPVSQRGAPPSAHPALYAADERQSGALHPDAAPRVGVPARLSDIAAANRGAARLALLLQSVSRPRCASWPDTHQLPGARQQCRGGSQLGAAALDADGTLRSTIPRTPIAPVGANVQERSLEASDPWIANIDLVLHAGDQLLRPNQILKARRRNAICYSMNGLVGLTPCLPYRHRLSCDQNRYEVCSDRSHRSRRSVNGEYFEMDRSILLLLDGDAVVAMAAGLLLYA
jgi:hypothetical protein